MIISCGVQFFGRDTPRARDCPQFATTSYTVTLQHSLIELAEKAFEIYSDSLGAAQVWTIVFVMLL